MTLRSKHPFPVVVFLLFFATFITNGQDNEVVNLPNNLEEIIITLDSEFWKSYNACDLDQFRTFLTEDLEFYHDKAGLTTTSAKLMDQIANGLCSDENIRLRREAVDGSVQVYPLQHYGAIITGEHVFYLREKGKTERLIEKAKFTHVWKFENEQWRMSRVLSFNHQQVSENTAKKEIALSTEALAAFAGQYQAPQTGLVTISLSSDNILNMDAGQMKAQLHPETQTVFFVKEAPITLEFVQNTLGNTIKFIVRERGKVVEEAKRVN